MFPCGPGIARSAGDPVDAGESQLYAMVGRLRDPRLDHALQLAADHAGHGCDLKIRPAESSVSNRPANGPDQQYHSYQWKYESSIGDRFPRSLLRKEDQHWQGNHVPQPGENPCADHAGSHAALDPSLRPIIPPEPRFCGMLGLRALLFIEKPAAEDCGVDESKSDAAKDQAKGQEEPVLWTAIAIHQLTDPSEEGEESKHRKGQREQAEKSGAEFACAIHSATL